MQDETNQSELAACCIRKNVSTGLVGKRMTVPFLHWLQWVVFLADDWMNKGALMGLFKVWTLQEQTRMRKPLTSDTKQKSRVSMAGTSSWSGSLGQTGWIDQHSLHALKGSSDVIYAFLFYEATLKADSEWQDWRIVVQEKNTWRVLQKSKLCLVNSDNKKAMFRQD